MKSFLRPVSSADTATWLSVPVEQVVAAVELQADIARPSGETWSGYTREALRPGSTPRRAVAELGHTGAQFLIHVDARLPDLTAVTLPESDAVHGDLEAGNILVGRDAQTIGIIDMDACGPGTRALDYAWLLRDAWAHDAGAGLRLASAGRVGPRRGPGSHRGVRGDGPGRRRAGRVRRLSEPGVC